MKIIKKHKEMKQVEVIDERYTQCDKCGLEIDVEMYDAFECVFQRKIGNSYPEGGSGEEETLDICQDCSVKLVELLKENGYNVISKDWDW